MSITISSLWSTVPIPAVTDDTHFEGEENEVSYGISALQMKNYVLDGLILDEDDMASGSSAAAPSQASVVAYIAAQSFLTAAALTGTARSYTKQQYFARSELTIDGTAAIDWAVGDNPCAYVTLDEDATLNLPTGIQTGIVYTLDVYMDGTGGHSLGYNAGINWTKNGAPPTLDDSANGWTRICFYSPDGTDVEGFY